MAKVTLVYPRMLRKHLPEEYVYAPLGVLYIATLLRKNSIDCDVIDLTFIGWGEFEKRLKERNPDMVGFYLASPLMNIGIEAIKRARRILKDATFIAGGPHTTAAPDEVLALEEIDDVILGEGEQPFLDYVRSGGKPPKEHSFIEDLDSLPFPDRDLLDMDRYNEVYNTHPIMASRGCPFNCLYCQPMLRKMFGNRVRRRSPENVIAEMEHITKRFGRADFFFCDDTFTTDRNWTMRLCWLLLNHDYMWSCNARVDMVDDELLAMMKRSGCRSIHYGIESGSQRILNFMRKGTTREQTINAFKLTHKNGIYANAFVMVGFPTETKKDLEDTVDIIRRTHPDGVRPSITTPIIGSDLYEYCKKKGTINITNYDDYDYCDNKYPIKLAHLTQDDLLYYIHKIMKTYKHGILRRNLFKYMKMLLHEKHKLISVKRFFSFVLWRPSE